MKSEEPEILVRNSFGALVVREHATKLNFAIPYYPMGRMKFQGLSPNQYSQISIFQHFQVIC